MPGMSWDAIHAMSQTPLRAPTDPVTTIRRTATIRRGTRMIKLLSRRQLSAYLHGRRPSGFCYREHDLTLLRGSADLPLLVGDAMPADSRGGQAVAYGLRWRAIDPADYHIPFADGGADEPAYPGLRDISPHDRLGPPVLGTGFAPSQQHLVPEFVTADLADRAGVRPERDRPQWRVGAARSVPGRDVRDGGRPAARVPGAGQSPGRPVRGRLGGPPDPLRPLARRRVHGGPG
jgi:hypothetical protein